MRPVFPNDIEKLCHALYGLPHDQQIARADQVIASANIADSFRKRLRRNHPRFGSGSLASAIDWPQPTRTAHCDTAYLEALYVVVTRLLAHKHNNL